MTITGRDGRTLRDVWGDEPSAYLGITVPGFPNLFCVYGPGTNLAHGGSLIFQSECQLHYILDAIRRVLVDGHAAIEVRADAAAEYRERYRGEIKQMVWSHASVKHSHFKNPEGRDLHAVAVADPDLLALDAGRRPGALRVHVTEAGAVEVRAATADDLAAVLGILDEAAAWLWSQGIRQWPQYFEPQWVLPRLDAGETWLAWSGSEAVGTFTLQWDDAAWSDHHDDDAGYVHRLAVRRSAAGLGRELLDARGGPSACLRPSLPAPRLHHRERDAARVLRGARLRAAR